MRSRALIWTLVVAALTTITSSAQRSTSATDSYGRLPLTFEVNQGQTSSDVRFLSRGPGYTAFLTAGGIVLSLRASAPVAGSASASESTAASATVRFTLVGAAKNPAVVGEDPQPGRVNYFFGNDPTKWHTNIPTYGRVRYKNVYPGIDLIYYENRGQLEYDFAVQPGSDPRKIQFAIQGARQIQLDQEDNVVLRLGSGEIHFQSPIIYQESAGRRTPVDGSYVMTDSTHIAFQVGDYDISQPLVIDPVLSYSTYLGGSGTTQATGIAVDQNGSVYLAGYTSSVNFPLATLGSLSANAYHAFVAKLDSAGANLIYADYIGGNSEDYGIALVLDSANEVYVTGSTTSSNFPAVNAYQAQQPGPYAGFLTKVSADGSSLVYSTYLGGNTFDQPTSIAIDSLGEVHVAGYTMSQNFPVVNAYQPTAVASQGGSFGVYGFLTKFSASGSSLIYSTYLAGNLDVAQTCGSTTCWPSPYNAISALAVDANGSAYVAGTTNTNNFPVTSGVYLASNSTQQDASLGFVSKFGSAGGLDYSTYFYGSSGSGIGISAIAVDASGSAYIAGNAESDGTFPITSTSICDPGAQGFACSYAFVTKFDAGAATLLYSTFLGPNNYASPQSLALDANDNAYVLSSTSSAAFQTNDAIEPYMNNADLLLVEIDPLASTQLFSTYLGGSGTDSPGGMTLDSATNVYLTGFTNSTDFPVGQGAFQNQLAGNIDAYVMKVGAGSAPMVALGPSAIQFSSLRVGSTSQAQQILLRDMSSGPLTVASITVQGDYAENNNCVGSVPAAGNCTISVTFTPTAAGSRPGSILINDTATGSPQVVALSGIGLGAVVGLTPTPLTFPNVPLGSSSSAQTVTLSNQGNAALSIANIQITGDYAQTNNCPVGLAISSSCTFNIVFTPTVSGNRTGTLTIVDNAAGSPQSVALSGTGADFGLSSSQSTNTVKAGTTATYTVTVAPLGGAFSSAVKLACSGAPAQSSCSVSPASVTPGSNPASVTISVNTTGSTTAATQLGPLQPGSVRSASSLNRPMYAVWLSFPGFGLLGIMLVGATRRRKKAHLVMLALIGMLLLETACAGGTGIGTQNQTPTPTGTYTITVTGASGSLQHSLPLTLTVQ